MSDPMKAEVTFERLLDAPVAKVWRAWTDPVELAKWWGPHHFTNPECEVDARPGGRLWVVMRGPDGSDYPMSAEFQEVVTNERLVFLAVAEDRDGNPQLRSLTTVSFEDAGGKTRLRVHAAAEGLVPIAAQMLEGMEAGWSQSLERLQASVA